MDNKLKVIDAEFVERVEGKVSPLPDDASRREILIRAIELLKFLGAEVLDDFYSFSANCVIIRIPNSVLQENGVDLRKV